MTSAQTTTSAVTYAPPAAGLARWRRLGLAAAAIGGIACVAGAVQSPDQFYRSYLVAWVFWLEVALGGLGLVLLNHLTHGAWGIVLRRVFEAAAGTLPFLGILFVPIAFGIPSIYSWSHPEIVAADAALRQKAVWLDAPFFIGRTVFYFAVWVALAWSIRRGSLAQDRTGEAGVFRRLQAVSAAGLILFVLTCSFAAFDWLMSIDPHWISSIYGLQFVGGCAVEGLAFAIVVSRYLVQAEPMAGILKPKHHQDHGTLLFSFLLLWGYFNVSQLIIIWSGNLPLENVFYLKRFKNGWEFVTLALVVLHFALPFVLLLSPALKRDVRRLALVAGMLLVMRWVDIYWQAMPNYSATVSVHWLDLAALIGIGGVFLALFGRGLAGPSLLPLHDPFLPEAVEHE